MDSFVSPSGLDFSTLDFSALDVSGAGANAACTCPPFEGASFPATLLEAFPATLLEAFPATLLEATALGANGDVATARAGTAGAFGTNTPFAAADVGGIAGTRGAGGTRPCSTALRTWLESPGSNPGFGDASRSSSATASSVAALRPAS